MSKTTYILIFTIFGAGILGFFLISQSGGDSNVRNGSLSLNEDSFDFETISMADGVVSHDFELKNESQAEVKIKKVYSSCGCTTAKVVDSEGKEYGKFGMPGHGLPTRTSITLNSGEKAIVQVFFDPAAHGLAGLGYVSRAVYLETNSSLTPKLQIVISAQVTR